MNIGLIVYSKTGNTESVARKLKDSIEEAGHSAVLELLRVGEGYGPGASGIQFKSLPDTEKFDALVFGSPVEAFSLPVLMRRYFELIAPLEGKKAGLLMTQHFPYAWMGGNSAMRQMKSECESKGGVVCGSAIINWSNKRRDKQIEAGVAALRDSLLYTL